LGLAQEAFDRLNFRIDCCDPSFIDCTIPPQLLQRLILMNTSTFKSLALLFLAAAVSFVASGSLWAAAIVIDDTAADDTITVSANDFELGLLLNGATFQSGLGNPAVTVPPLSEVAPLEFLGTWITFGQQGPAGATIYLVESPYDPALPTTPLISDILRYQITPNTDGFTATIQGSFVSDTEDNLGFVPPGTNPAFVFLETGKPVNLSFVGLSVQVISDVDVPEPSSVCLAALGLVGLAAIGYRHRKRSIG
jgi:hypothetical protein